MMRGKLVLLVGVGIGYVLGARAGRGRYEEIKRGVSRLWNDPRVSQQVQNVEQFAKDKAPEVVDFLGETAKKVLTHSPSTGSTKKSGETKKKSTAAKKAPSSTTSAATKKK